MPPLVPETPAFCTGESKPAARFDLFLKLPLARRQQHERADSSPGSQPLASAFSETLRNTFHKTAWNLFTLAPTTAVAHVRHWEKGEA